ncbi:MAG: hydrogenase maturation protease [Magnetococcus sp. THC-1_WYH]
MEWSVIGLGNRNAGDDGIGLTLVEGMAHIFDKKGVTLHLWEEADPLTVAQNLLELTGPVLIVDCADMGLPPGEWRAFPCEENTLRPDNSSVSTHGLGMAQALALARGLGYAHPIHLFGIQPFDLSPQTGLSSGMRQRVPAMIDALAGTTRRLGSAPATPLRGPAPRDDDRGQIIHPALPLGRRVLAMGIETKNAPVLGGSEGISLPSLLGDTTTPGPRSALEKFARRVLEDPAIRPDVIAVDLHPDMFPSVLGRRLAQEHAIPLITVQHHHAHAAACMVEHQLEECVALVCDGMGWGEDGTLWGAEALHVTPRGCTRLGTFAPVPLPGGDRAVAHPLRQLFARWIDAGIEPGTAWHEQTGCTASETSVWSRQCQNGLNAPLSHAAGRLFDTFAAALGIAPESIAFEGEPAIRLETLARSYHNTWENPPHLPYLMRMDGAMNIIDWRPTFRLFSPSRQFSSEALPLWAFSFHQSVARALGHLARHALAHVGPQPIVLSGGVFMNGLLRECLDPILRPLSCRFFFHRHTPCGDAGIALGQAWVAGRKV